MRNTMPNTWYERAAANAAFVVALAKSQLLASFALRAAFFTSAFAMLLNDLLLFVTWWVIMQRFGHVQGWRLEDVMCLYAVALAGVGLCLIAFGGIHDLSRKIHDGELDALLTQPKSVLFQLLASRTQASGWGDLVAAVALFIASGVIGWRNLPGLVIAVFCSAVTFTACAVVMHGLAFWLGRIQSLSRSLWEFTLTFSLYPPVLFDGAIRAVLFTLLPAGLVSFLPIELARHPSARTLAITLAATALYAAFAVALFARGLRHYESGNRLSNRTG